ncbi:MULTISPECIES: hypothetical protein [Streptomyces]|uniref:hypothetical protein n=1 Tax=Streptomyces TaxID=1883 RepID=UPI002E2E5BD9|nr:MULTISPECIES: hypothetical protein [Streptomyces]
MSHHLRKRPEGRLQCTRCRAAFVTRESAGRARFDCPDEALAHGLLGQREHVVYPTWSKDRSCSTWGCPDPDPAHDFHGPDPFCDETACGTCLHDCDCDVCEGRATAPGLYRLIDSREV